MMSFRAPIGALMLLAALVVLLAGLAKNVVQAKGKVPIYMPVPIPIPMPMGPSGGGVNHHQHQHHHQQQQQHEDEGEVKKIYLLQPMPKVQPQPQLKGGGFMGPVQTHIHMPPPVLQQSPQLNKVRHPARYQQQQQQHSLPPPPSSSYDDELPPKYQHQSAGKSSHSDMKILPIVVIPPIAPMPPIQLPSAAGDPSLHRPARLTLKPQFNNYVMSASPARRSAYQQHGMGAHHDHKTFADYGFPGDQIGARSRLRSRQTRPTGSDYGSSAARSNRLRAYDDYGGDDYELSPSMWRSSSASHNNNNNNHYSHHSSRSNARRRSSSFRDDGGRHRASANSINDIIEQQALFDDDDVQQHSKTSSSFDSSDFKDPARGGESCCGSESSARRYRQHLAALDDIPMADSSFDEQRETDGPFESHLRSNYGSDQRAKLSSSSEGRQQHQYSNEASSSGRDDLFLGDRDSDLSPRARQYHDLSAVYYDRELQNDAAKLMSSRFNTATGRNRASGRRPNLADDGRNLLDDDEWRFDSIKSVVHAGPQVNAKATNTTVTSDSNSTNITAPATSTISTAKVAL